jgi:hypothetical protein
LSMRAERDIACHRRRCMRLLGMAAAGVILVSYSCHNFMLMNIIWLDGLSGDAFLNIEPGLFKVWDPSNQLWVNCCFNLPLKLLDIVDCEFEHDFVFYDSKILQTCCDYLVSHSCYFLKTNDTPGHFGHALYKHGRFQAQFGLILYFSEHSQSTGSIHKASNTLVHIRNH